MASHWILRGWDLVKYDVNESEQDAPFYESNDIKQLSLAMNTDFFVSFMRNVWIESNQKHSWKSVGIFLVIFIITLEQQRETHLVDCS